MNYSEKLFWKNLHLPNKVYAASNFKLICKSSGNSLISST
jgi:hypothetical protein